MNLSHIRCFLAVVETGSFTRAAERVHLSQPTLSAAIRRLEDWLGAPMFERSRKVRLTPAGTRFIERARRMLEEAQAARAETREEARGERLRIGLLQTLASHHIGPLLGDFRRTHPEMRLELLEGSREVLAVRLEQGRIDAAINLIGAETGRPDTLVLFKERYVVAAPASHPLTRRARLALADLHGEAFILRPDCEVQEDARRLFLAHGVQPRIVLRCRADDRAMALVAGGIGLSLVPESFLIASTVPLTMPELTFSRRIGLVRQTGTPASEALTLFQGFAASHDWGAGAEPESPRRRAARLEIAH